MAAKKKKVRKKKATPRKRGQTKWSAKKPTGRAALPPRLLRTIDRDARDAAARALMKSLLASDRARLAKGGDRAAADEAEVSAQRAARATLENLALAVHKALDWRARNDPRQKANWLALESRVRTSPTLSKAYFSELEQFAREAIEGVAPDVTGYFRPDPLHR